jgi:hypothetical protein
MFEGERKPIKSCRSEKGTERHQLYVKRRRKAMEAATWKRLDKLNKAPIPGRKKHVRNTK